MPQIATKIDDLTFDFFLNEYKLPFSCQNHTCSITKKGTKKFNSLKGNMMDLDKKYLSLSCIFQNNVENSQLQNDVRVIVGNGKVLDRKTSKIVKLKRCKLFIFQLKSKKQHLGLSVPK